MGDAGVTPGPGATALRLDAALLVLLWLGALVAWPSLPERIPYHLDPAGPDRWVAHDAGGLVVWLLLPILATGTSLLLRALSRYGADHPDIWSLPRKREFLALDPAARTPVVAALRAMVGRTILATTLMIAVAQLALGLAAHGHEESANAVMYGAAALIVVIVVLSLRTMRTTGRLIESASTSARGNG